MKLLFIYPILVVILTASCGSTKETKVTSATSTETKSNPSTTMTTSDPAADAGLAPNDSTYRIIVSFISIGEGVDSKALETLESMIGSWDVEKKGNLDVEKMHWGREGEVDYCFKLKSLSANDQETFISEIQSAFKDNKLVQIAENQPARHKR